MLELNKENIQNKVQELLGVSNSEDISDNTYQISLDWVLSMGEWPSFRRQHSLEGNEVSSQIAIETRREVYPKQFYRLPNDFLFPRFLDNGRKFRLESFPLGTPPEYERLLVLESLYFSESVPPNDYYTSPQSLDYTRRVLASETLMIEPLLFDCIAKKVLLETTYHITASETIKFSVYVDLRQALVDTRQALTQNQNYTTDFVPQHLAAGGYREIPSQVFWEYPFSNLPRNYRRSFQTGRP